MAANLLYHVSDKSGLWFARGGDCDSAKLRLSRPDDAVTLAGPLTVNVSLVAENTLRPAGAGEARTSLEEVYSYDLEIPLGHTWSYRLSDAAIPVAEGGNAGWSVIIRPGQSKRPPGVQPTTDIPCDFASAPIPDTGAFFPSGCEGCPPGSTVSQPPTCGPSLAIPSAPGGCVRPRFYNGMLMTREDMETQLRYFRLKMRIHNRAAGEGVVWGLGEDRRGGKVRVETGYAVDCCGNDLTVTCPYEVNVQSLLSDPANCNTLSEGPRRLHLLLEYVECPEEPRPVHGDACSPQTTLCEMSRVRETVRLRLVPPRDYVPNGPIGDFLASLRENFFAVGPIDRVTTASSSSALHAAAIARAVPFEVEVKVSTNKHADDPVRDPNPLRLTPPVAPAATVEGDTGATFNQTPAGVDLGTTRVTLRAHTGFHFQAGSPVLIRQKRAAPGVAPRVVVEDVSPPQPIVPVITAPDQIAWDFLMPEFFDAPETGPPPSLNAEVAFRLQDWRMADEAGNQVSGNTEVGFVLRLEPIWRQTDWGRSRGNILDGNRAILHVALQPTTLSIAEPGKAGPWPCLTEACAPGDRRRFPVLPPFAHEDLFGSLAPADPKVLLLSAVYGVLAMVAGRYKSAEEAQAASEVRGLTLVYQALWHAFFRLAPDAAGRHLSENVRGLFRDWCRDLLYPGPSCRGEPHGVVIGCALVQGGDLCAIDPWGGRRWVVHYPLLAHWGEQFGFVPPDVQASRLFDLICCIGDHLNVPPPPRGTGDQARGSTTHLTTTTFSQKGSHLVFGAREDARARLVELGVQAGTWRTVPLFDFVSRVVALMRQPPSEGKSYSIYTPEGFPNVVLAVPDAGTGAVAILPDRARIVALVNPAFAPTTTAVAPLLREFASDLAMELLDEATLIRLDERNLALAPLAQAGVATVSDLLARSPEALSSQALGVGLTAELTALLTASEKSAVTVARAVGEAVPKQSAGGAATRSDFARPEIASRLGSDLSRALKAILPGEDAASRAIKRATGATESRV